MLQVFGLVFVGLEVRRFEILGLSYLEFLRLFWYCSLFFLGKSKRFYGLTVGAGVA